MDEMAKAIIDALKERVDDNTNSENAFLVIAQRVDVGSGLHKDSLERARWCAARREEDLIVIRLIRKIFRTQKAAK